MFDKIVKWWLFHVRNPKIRSGEQGGFKWVFRRFTLDISSLSGNFLARFTAAEHPYGYLMAGEDSQTHGFAERLYLIGTLLTTDQGFVNDIDQALTNAYKKRVPESVPESSENEEAILAFEKSVQEHVEMPPKERRKVERDINGRFKKAVKNAEKHES